MTDRWAQIWEGRTLDRSRGSTLAQLMAADGLDTAFGRIDEGAWTRFVRAEAERLNLQAGDEVYEVGCGAGALLYELRRQGLRCAGLDRSASLISCARAVLPDGRFEVAEAAELPRQPPADAVVSFGVFLYFPSLDYATRVIERMAAKARRAVAVLDVPDARLQDQALAQRAAALGGATAYAARYAGLEHQYYDRDWLITTMRRTGLVNVEATDQDIAGYPNAQFRFNVRASASTT